MLSSKSTTFGAEPVSSDATAKISQLDTVIKNLEELSVSNPESTASATSTSTSTSAASLGSDDIIAEDDTESIAAFRKDLKERAEAAAAQQAVEEAERAAEHHVRAIAAEQHIVSRVVYALTQDVGTVGAAAAAVDIVPVGVCVVFTTENYRY